ncbi:MAG TPA: dienelactone hydrolase family protein [Terricaulis sp.]|nr:dienelactone hydrolase family protein [Terricaulis sp.]
MRLDTPEGNLAPSRRTIAASLFFSGYATAALSSCASPVQTPADELIIGDVHVPGAGGYQLPAYVARPNDREAHGAVIVVNEIFGIHDYIKDVCRRFAREGYVAIAPDYFDRAGDPAPLTDFAQIRQIVAAATYEQVMGDTAGALDWLADQRFVRDRAIGITGFCWGGAVTWMAAARFRQIKAGVASYGRLAPPPADGFGFEPGRPWPVNVAANLQAPVLGLYAENDRGIPLDTVEQMRAALSAVGNPTNSEIVVYPGADHGFHADYRESYKADAAADGWARCLAWFRANGVA